MINKLIEIIGREAAIFESFLELLEEQQQMLVENNIEGLNQVTDKQREKVVQSKLLNKERLKLVEAIKADNHIEDNLTISRLIKLVDKNQADRLQKLQTSILGLNNKITEMRNQNAMLLNRSREYILKTMEMLSEINSPDSTYTKSSKSSEHNLNVAIDRRV